MIYQSLWATLEELSNRKERREEIEKLPSSSFREFWKELDVYLAKEGKKRDESWFRAMAVLYHSNNILFHSILLPEFLEEPKDDPKQWLEKIIEQIRKLPTQHRLVSDAWRTLAAVSSLETGLQISDEEITLATKTCNGAYYFGIVDEAFYIDLKQQLESRAVASWQNGQDLASLYDVLEYQTDLVPRIKRVYPTRYFDAYNPQEGSYTKLGAVCRAFKLAYDNKPQVDPWPQPDWKDIFFKGMQEAHQTGEVEEWANHIRGELKKSEPVIGGANYRMVIQ